MSNTEAPQKSARGSYGAIGLLIGASLGFLLRPSFPLVGKLPIAVVITRGATLSGLDQLLLPTAHASFNYLLAGALVGLVAGIIAGGAADANRKTSL